jgi:hypothetical protein
LFSSPSPVYTEKVIRPKRRFINVAVIFPILAFGLLFVFTGPHLPSVVADDLPTNALNVNLLTNPDFSAGLTGWSDLWTRESGQGKAEIIQRGTAGFAASLSVEHAGGKDWSCQQSAALQAGPGEVYRYSGWIDFRGAGTVELSVILYDKNRNVMNWSFGRSETSNTNGWKRLDRKFLVPALVSSLRFRITGTGPGTAVCTGLSLQKTGNIPPGPNTDIAIGNSKIDIHYYGSEYKLVISAPGQQPLCMLEDFGRAILPATLKVKNKTTLGFSVFNAFGDDAAGEIAIKPDNSVSLTLSGAGPMEEETAFPGTWRAAAGTSWVIPENEGLLVSADDPYYDQPWGKSFYSGHGGFSMPFIGLTDGRAGWLMIVETPDDAGARFTKPAGGLLSSWQPGWQPARGEWAYPRRVAIRFVPDGGYVGIAKAYRAFAKTKGLLLTLQEKAKANPNVARLPGTVDLWFWKKAEAWQAEPDPRAVAQEIFDAGIRRVLWSSEASAQAVVAMNNLGFITGRYDIYQDVYPPDAPGWLSKLNREAWPDGLVLDRYGERISGWVARENGREIKAGVVCSRPGLELLKRHTDEELKTKAYTARFIDTTTASSLRECYNPAHPQSRSQDREFKFRQLAYLARDKKLVTGSETGLDWAVPALDYFEGMMSLGNFRLPDAGYDLTSLKTPTSDFLRFQVGSFYRIPLFELVYHDCVVSYYYWGDASNRLPDWWTVRDLYSGLYGTGPLWIMDYARWKNDKERFVKSYETATTVAARTGLSEMLEHRFLTADHSVQYTRFANGVRVWVNFGSALFRLPDGRTLAALTLVTQ